VVIIDEVHQLSGDAFAALLKTLEEPPPHVVFVFATTDPLKLPDTIRSRCQRYDFGRLPMPDIVTRLKEIAKGESSSKTKIKLADEAAFLLARKSEGSMRDAVSALDQVLSTGVTEIDEAAINEVLGLVSREVFFELGETILSRDPQGALAALHKAYREGVDPRDLAEGILDHLRSHLVLRVDPKAEDLVVASEDEHKRYETMGLEHDTADLLRLMRLITETLGAMRDSAQPLTHLEVAVVQMANLEPGVRLAEILERLGALETADPAGDDGGGKGRKTPAPVRSASSRRKPASRPARKSSGEPAPVEAWTATEPPVLPVTPSVPPAVTTPPVAQRVAEVSGETATAVALEEEVSEENGEWQEVVRRVKDRKLMVGVFLEESRRMGWDGAVLKLAADEVHRSLLEAADNRELLAKALSDVYGRAVRVRFVDAPEDKRSVAETSQAETTNGGEGAGTNGEPATGGAQSGGNGGPERDGHTSAPQVVEAEGESGKPTSDISPAVEQAMVWSEGEIVQQSEPGGAGK
jgi:DNA polymerase-3 subunit gamma/tau